MSTRRPSDSPRPNDPPAGKKPPPVRRARAPREDKEQATPEAPAPVLMTPRRIEISADKRRAMIAEAAYLRAERRGFEPGHDVEDWTAAEAEVNALLQHGNGTTAQ